jgi:tetratricopeptide (TPR) repeat protein
MTLDKLKVAARQHEQREDWRAAIDVYRQAIHAAEADSGVGDPSLYNRIGDLEQKSGDDSAACEAWEQAAARYGEQGFFNNAIALCGKILRLDPSRIRTYLELARYQARKRVLYEVTGNLTIYRDQMNNRGQAEPARNALEHFAGEFPNWRELHRVIDGLLGRDSDDNTDGGTVAGEGDTARGLVFLDTNTEPAAATPPNIVTAPATPESTELVLETTTMVEFDTPETTTMPGLEPTSGEAATADTEQPDVTGLVNIERTAQEVGETAPLAGLESTALDISAADIQPMEGLEQDGGQAPTDLVFIATEVDVVAPPDSTTPEDDPLGTRVTAHALIEHGDRLGGVAALERALDGYVEQEEWSRAYHVATELIQADPASINRYQARVEIAARMRDNERLAQSYLELGDTLEGQGAREKAIAVYRRILEIDENHVAARVALRRMAPETITPAGDEGFIDFGAMVNDDVGPRTTRMRTEMPAVAPDEDETFRDALAEFKRALDQNLSAEDHQTHYDLGLAFKEMGLLDEAIGSFQKALRSPEGRLRTSEALGQTFFEQGRPAVAEAVLRSVERGPEGDSEKIGVLYWIARAIEAQNRGPEALAFYERVMAVDVSFQDVADRATRLMETPGA